MRNSRKRWRPWSMFTTPAAATGPAGRTARGSACSRSRYRTSDAPTTSSNGRSPSAARSCASNFHTSSCGARPWRALSAVRQHGEARIVERETEFGADLEVVGDDARVGRHLRAFVAHRIGQRIPAGEIGRIPLRRREARARGRDWRRRRSTPSIADEARDREHPRRAPPSARPLRERRGHERQQRVQARRASSGN